MKKVNIYLDSIKHIKGKGIILQFIRETYYPVEQYNTDILKALIKEEFNELKEVLIWD